MDSRLKRIFEIINKQTPLIINKDEKVIIYIAGEGLPYVNDLKRK